MKPTNTKFPKLSKNSETFDILSFVEKIEIIFKTSTDPMQTAISYPPDYKGDPITPQDVASLTLSQKNKLDPVTADAYRRVNYNYDVREENEQFELYQERDLEKLLFKTRKTYHGTCYAIVKEFHNSGQIKSKYLEYVIDALGVYTKVGIGYEYDKHGKFIKEVDYEQGYSFTSKDVLDYLIKNKITIPNGPDIVYKGYPEITRVEEKGEKRWFIEYQTIQDGILIHKDTLDGQTGVLIKREKQEPVHYHPPRIIE